MNNIKYFGNKDYQDIAIGDAIVGESYAKRYRTKGRIQYGFGLTNILHCGVMKMDETVAGIRGATSINPRIISDYDRGDFLVAKLVYSAVYKASLNRYRKKTIENLKHINLTIGIKIINFEKENYHSRFTDGDLLAERPNKKATKKKIKDKKPTRKEEKATEKKKKKRKRNLKNKGKRHGRKKDK